MIHLILYYTTPMVHHSNLHQKWKISVNTLLSFTEKHNKYKFNIFHTIIIRKNSGLFKFSRSTILSRYLLWSVTKYSKISVLSTIFHITSLYLLLGLCSLLREKPTVVLHIANTVVRRLSSFVRQVDFALDWIFFESGRAIYRWEIFLLPSFLTFSLTSIINFFFH
jgi:hypothetical protein